MLLSSVLFVLSTEDCMHNSVAVGCFHTHIHIHSSTCAPSFACVSKIILEDKDIMFIVFNKKCLFFALFVSSSLILFLVLWLLLLPPYLLLFAKYVFFLFVKLSTNSLRLPGLMDGWMDASTGRSLEHGPRSSPLLFRANSHELQRSCLCFNLVSSHVKTQQKSKSTHGDDVWLLHLLLLMMMIMTAMDQSKRSWILHKNWRWC